MAKLICPFCNAELFEEMYNSVYGCDTGCEYIRIEIKCPKCKKVTWDSGAFGSYENQEEREEYREEFMQEFAKELQRIAPDRIKED
jgi:Zn-finger nucleic acid-binding protein